MTKAHLELTGVEMAFATAKGPFVALDNVNLKIRKGEFVSLIGHSGCGKSTVLNIVAGLLQATKGGCGQPSSLPAGTRPGNTHRAPKGSNE